MSHFTVLIIGDDPEKQLEPYSEHLEVAPTDQGIVPNEELARFFEHYKEKYPKKTNFMMVVGTELLADENVVTLEKMYKKHGREWNGNTWRKHTDGTWHEYSTYNPNSKWDWYSIGGRWSGFFKLKPGGEGKIGELEVMAEKVTDKTLADQLLKKDIDFELMFKEAEEKANKEFDRAEELFKDTPQHKSWAQIISEHEAEEKAGKKYEHEDWRRFRIEEYETQERVKLADEISKALLRNKERSKKELTEEEQFTLSVCRDVDEYIGSREEYVEKCKFNAVSTFALMVDGVWHESGKMGWFGMSHDDMDPKKWREFFLKTINEAPDDALFTVVDCHI